MDHSSPLASMLSRNGDLTHLVTEQMQRVLSHDLFRRSPRLSQLFRFMVEMSIQGKANSLKEYTIGVDVFNRPDSFDCRLDSIVRVEVARLRRKLKMFYRTSGSSDSVVLTLPPSGYEPVLSFRLRGHDGPSRSAGVALIQGKGVDLPAWTRTLDRSCVDISRFRAGAALELNRRYDLLIIFAVSETYSDYQQLMRLAGHVPQAVLFVFDPHSEAARLSVCSAIHALTDDGTGSLQINPPSVRTTRGDFGSIEMDSVA